MEQSASPRPENGEGYAFKYVDPANDTRVLQIITDDPSPIPMEWLTVLDKTIQDGSADLHPWKTPTVSMARKVTYARSEVERLLCLTTAGYPLYTPYKKLIGAGEIPISSTLYGSIVALQEITGDVVATAHREYLLLSKDPQTLYRHYRILCAVAEKLGWEGDVRALVREKPRLLIAGEKKTLALARLALEHGNGEQKSMSRQEVARTFASQAVEMQLAALLLNDNYRFGDYINYEKQDAPVRSVPEARRIVLEAITNVQTLKKLGREVARAYLHYRPPTEAEMKAYSYSKNFVSLSPVKKRPGYKEKLHNSSHQKVTGDETWIEEMHVTTTHSRIKWLTLVNESIRIGSQSLIGKKPDSSEYREIMAHRERFPILMGWHSNLSIRGAIHNFKKELPTFVTPERIVDFFDLCTTYSIKPINSILESFFDVLGLKPETTEKKLAYISQRGLDVNKTVQENPHYLRMGMTALAEALDRKIDRGKAHFRQEMQATNSTPQ